MKRTFFIITGIVVLLTVLVVGKVIGTYNSLVSLNQEVDGQWAQVENAYQRRADLVPNLVETVKGAAAHERQTFEAITEARAKVGQVNLGGKDLSNPEAFAKYQQAQDGLSSALSRLLVVSENYPQLKANENFLGLQAQLEGTENRITVERMRFNEAAKQFNTLRQSFPTVLFVGMFGDQFEKKVFFQAQAGAENAPKVQF